MGKAKILVTGGAGYIGSHMVRVLLAAGYAPVVFDNLSTGHRQFVPKGVPLIKGDLRCLKELQAVFRKHAIDAVLHFAAAIVVPESVSDPLKYYEHNVTGSLNLLSAMHEAGVGKIVFSSSACVYGEPRSTPVAEDAPLQVENPYGATKIMVEQFLRDLGKAGKMKFMALRYFNVAGAHPSGEIGIKMARPTHLIPNVMRVLAGKQGKLTIFGTDYPTPDGTCVRDYVHVMDLCEAHLLALKALCLGRLKNEVINLGNGRGFSVKEVVAAAEHVTGKKVRLKMARRRPGDPASVVASFTRAKRLLGWTPKRDLNEILSSAWAWEHIVGRSGK